MEQRKCMNKKCRRILPEGYMYKYCENCRNEQAKIFKGGCIGALSVALSLGISVITKGKINLNKTE